MTIRHILEAKGRDVFTTTADTPMETVAALLVQQKIGAIVVTDDQGGVAGIVSERDVVRLVVSEGAAGLSMPVFERMTREVVKGEEDMSLDEAMELMTRGRFRHLPICQGKHLVGIISIGDAVKRRLEQVQQEAEEMRTYIHTA
ncbi:CBS domain-containing protein [Aureimonas mangrovi]|uniref:CBS domain-containing protein n=1 Tax=Aureimonas mangrovi TaxID=2758041 RepID=UPI00163D9A8E|nr:CBS domain-containing protein [Aureimonas mangrovi]